MARLYEKSHDVTPKTDKPSKKSDPQEKARKLLRRLFQPPEKDPVPDDPRDWIESAYHAFKYNSEVLEAAANQMVKRASSRSANQARILAKTEFPQGLSKMQKIVGKKIRGGVRKGGGRLALGVGKRVLPLLGKAGKGVASFAVRNPGSSLIGALFGSELKQRIAEGASRPFIPKRRWYRDY